jgi:hypothetical protein
MTATQSTHAAPIARQSDEGEALWFLGILTTIKASAETTGGRLAVIEPSRTARLGPAAARPPPRGRMVLRDRGRAHVLGRRAGDQRTRRHVHLTGRATSRTRLRSHQSRPGSCSSPNRPASSTSCARSPSPHGRPPFRRRQASRPTFRASARSPPSTGSRSSALPGSPPRHEHDRAAQSPGRPHHSIPSERGRTMRGAQSAITESRGRPT